MKAQNYMAICAMFLLTGAPLRSVWANSSTVDGALVKHLVKAARDVLKHENPEVTNSKFEAIFTAHSPCLEKSLDGADPEKFELGLQYHDKRTECLKLINEGEALGKCLHNLPGASRRDYITVKRLIEACFPDELFERSGNP